MTVRTILEEKGRQVVTLAPTATLAEVATELAKRRIGALVLMDEAGDVAGIVSERDIVRCIGNHGASCLSQPVADVMTKDVVTCTEDTTLDQAAEMMSRGRFRHVPVCRNSKLIGIISIGDVVQRRIEAAVQEAAAMRDYITAG